METIIETANKPKIYGDASDFVGNRKKSIDSEVKQNIRIQDRLKSYIMPLSEENYKTLEESILKNGVQDPIILWKQELRLKPEPTIYYIIIDGHNRYEICKKHGIDFPYKIKEFENIEAVEAYMDEWQMSRRNLTPEQMSILRARIAKRKGFTHGGARGQNVHLENKEKIAKGLGVSPKTLQRDEAFYEGLEAIKAYNQFGNDLASAIVRGGYNTGIDKATVQNIGKALAKFPNEKMECLDDINQIYKKYRDSNSNAPQKPTISNFQNIAKGTTEKVLEKQLLEHLHRPEQNLYLDLTKEEQEKILEVQVLKYEAQIKDLKNSIQLEHQNYKFAVEMFEDKIKKLEKENAELKDVANFEGLRYELKIGGNEYSIVCTPATFEFLEFYFKNYNKLVKTLEEKEVELSEFKNLNFKHSGELVQLEKKYRVLEDKYDDLQTENNELRQQIADLQKAFSTHSTDERVKLTKKGWRLMRFYPHAPNFKITYFDLENCSWKLLEKFATKAALDRKVNELKEDENIIFE